jgi:hypothetical protein
VLSIFVQINYYFVVKSINKIANFGKFGGFVVKSIGKIVNCGEFCGFAVLWFGYDSEDTSSLYSFLASQATHFPSCIRCSSILHISSDNLDFDSPVQFISNSPTRFPPHSHFQSHLHVSYHLIRSHHFFNAQNGSPRLRLLLYQHRQWHPSALIPASGKA